MLIETKIYFSKWSSCVTVAVNILFIFSPEWKSVVKVVSASSHLAHWQTSQRFIKIIETNWS